MKLTDKMKEETITIVDRLQKLYNFIIACPKPIVPDLKKRLVTELSPYKIKLEYFFSETEDKEEKCCSLSALLMLERLLSELYAEVLDDAWKTQVQTYSDDFERYVKMGLQIAPNNVFLNLRYVSRNFY